MKTVTLFMFFLLGACASQNQLRDIVKNLSPLKIQRTDLGDIGDILDKLPSLNIDASTILKILADYGCAENNCLPLEPDVCPFQVFCQLYCKESQQLFEGACQKGSCGCFQLQL